MNNKYFVSFLCNGGSGNIVFEINTKITDCDSIDDCQNWINTLKNYIERKYNITGVTIINFICIDNKNTVNEERRK